MTRTKSDADAADSDLDLEMERKHCYSDWTFFRQCLEFGVCAICCNNSRNIFLFAIQDCDHRLCENCRSSPPTECPTCKKPYDPELLMLDHFFKAIWDNFIEMYGTGILNWFIKSNHTAALTTKSARESGRAKSVTLKETDSSSRDTPAHPDHSPSSTSRTPSCDSSRRAKSATLKETDSSAGDTPAHPDHSTPATSRTPSCNSSGRTKSTTLKETDSPTRDTPAHPDHSPSSTSRTPSCDSSRLAESAALKETDSSARDTPAHPDHSPSSTSRNPSCDSSGRAKSATLKETDSSACDTPAHPDHSTPATSRTPSCDSSRRAKSSALKETDSPTRDTPAHPDHSTPSVSRTPSSDSPQRAKSATLKETDSSIRDTPVHPDHSTPSVSRTPSFYSSRRAKSAALNETDSSTRDTPAHPDHSTPSRTPSSSSRRAKSSALKETDSPTRATPAHPDHSTPSVSRTPSSDSPQRAKSATLKETDSSIRDTPVHPDHSTPSVSRTPSFYSSRRAKSAALNETDSSTRDTPAHPDHSTPSRTPSSSSRRAKSSALKETDSSSRDTPAHPDHSTPATSRTPSCDSARRAKSAAPKETDSSTRDTPAHPDHSTPSRTPSSSSGRVKSATLKESSACDTPAHPNHSTPSTSRTPSCDSSGKPKSYLKKNKKGETVLHELCSLGFRKKRGFSVEKLREMLVDGANPNTTDGSGITPLHESIEYEHLSIMKTLLDGGAQVNGYGDPPYTRTPLHTAVEKYENWAFCGPLTTDKIAYKIITALLDYGADINLKDQFNRTPSDIAANNPAILKLLKDYKPNISVRVNLTAPEPPMVLMPSGNNAISLGELKAFETRFKVKCLTKKRGFKPEVTHLVVPNGTKNADHMIRMGILSGCYVIKMQWMSDCLEQDRLLPESKYELRDPLIPNSKERYVSRKARLDRLNMRPKLFVGGQFFVMSQDIDPNQRSEITELIQAGGGVVLSREPKPGDHGEDQPKLFHAPAGSKWENCSVVILYAREPRALYRMSHMKHEPLTWFLDCVDTYSIREQ